MPLPRRFPVRRRRWVLVPILLLLSLGVAPSALAQPAQAYMTYGPEDTGPVSGWALPIAAGQTVTVHLWLQGGGVASSDTPCALGATGTEICGVNLQLDGAGAFTFLDFVADPNRPFDSSGSGIPIVATASGSSLRLNALDPAASGLANRYLGRLTLAADPNATPEQTALVAGGVIGADLSMRDLESRPIVVPEPGVALGLLAGGWVLALGRSRHRRSRDARLA